MKAMNNPVMEYLIFLVLLMISWRLNDVYGVLLEILEK